MHVKMGVEFCHKSIAISDDVTRPAPLLFFLSLCLYIPVNKAIILQYTFKYGPVKEQIIWRDLWL